MIDPRYMSGRRIIIAGIALLLLAVYWGVLEFGPDEEVGADELQSSLQTRTPGKAISSNQSQMSIGATTDRDKQATARSQTLRPAAEEPLPGHDQTGVVYEQSLYPAFADKPQGSGPVLNADSREPAYTTGVVVQDTGPVLDADSREPVYTTDAVVQDTGPVLDADEAYRITGQGQANSP